MLSSVLRVSVTVEIDWVIEVVGSATMDIFTTSDVATFIVVDSDS